MNATRRRSNTEMHLFRCATIPELMSILRIVAIVIALLVLLVAGYVINMIFFANPRVERELLENPQGKRAGIVMLLTLPSGRRLPVNYYREDDKVFAGADGTWWKELKAGSFPVTVLIRGETLNGYARAVLDDPDYTTEVFAKLRPNAVKGFGTLVEITLDDEAVSTGR